MLYQKISSLFKKYLVDSQLNALFELPWCHPRPSLKSSTKVSCIRVTHDLANMLNRPITRFQQTSCVFHSHTHDMSHWAV
ncbi:hypothetical protein VCR12J2_50031 [Vibrio coralliirubri]|nr:hypothetical protein VCR12J2_50031 [Vibrio coralliirubri]